MLLRSQSVMSWKGDSPLAIQTPFSSRSGTPSGRWITGAKSRTA